MNKLVAAKGIKGAQGAQGQGKKATGYTRPGFAPAGAAPTKRVINPRGMRKK